VRRQVAKLPLGDAHRTTISIGVATHRVGDDPSSLVARADAALYMAKRSGRNAVRQEIAAAS
jgi:PleD family two-component response regulator